MTRRVSALVLVLLVVAPMLSVAAAPVAAQDQTSEWSPPGPFPLEDLRQGGSADPDAPPSARMLGDPVRGSAALRFTPVSPLQSDTEYLEPGSMLETDRLEFYSSAYGDATGEYTFVVVFWDEQQKTVNETTVSYAADQQVQRVTLDVESGYSTQEISLKSHFDEAVQATAWLERDGEMVPGARWRFEHRSNPLTAAPAAPIDSQGDLWRWAGINVFLPGIPGILIGRRGAKHVLNRTIVGPRKGMAWWGLVLGILTLILLAAGTWQTAAVLARAPFVAGLFIAAFSFVAFLGFRDQEVETAEFNQKDLEDVTSVTGEETKRARTEEITLWDIVRRDGNIYAPAKGIRPFLARYWAAPARVEEADLTTVNNVEGDVSKKFELDPKSEQPIKRTPARLAFEPQLTTDDEPDKVFETEETSALAMPYHVVNSIVGGFRSLNFGFLGPALLGGAVVYFAVQAALGVTAIAAGAALLPSLIAGYRAHDGALELDEAPYHFSEARAILAQERATYNEAQTFEELQQIVADIDLDEHERVQDFVEAFWDQVTTRFDSLQGPDSATSAANKMPGVSDD